MQRGIVLVTDCQPFKMLCASRSTEWETWTLKYTVVSFTLLPEHILGKGSLFKQQTTQSTRQSLSVTIKNSIHSFKRGGNADR